MARTRRQLFRLSLLVTILFIGLLGFSSFPWAINDLENQIVVRGNVFTSTNQIRTALSGSMYKPLYRLDPQTMEKKVQSLETVKTAFVRRYAFPRPQIIVEVLEEHPWASLIYQGQDPHPTAMEPGADETGESSGAAKIDAVIAESGRIIPTSKFPRVIQPPLKVYAMNGLKMTQNDVRQWATWVSFIEKQIGEPLDYIDMRKPFDVRIQTKTLALKIGVPDATLTQRLGRLISILPVLKQYQDNLVYVDLSLDTNIPLKVTKEAKNSNKKSVAQGARSGSERGPL